MNAFFRFIKEKLTSSSNLKNFPLEILHQEIIGLDENEVKILQKVIDQRNFELWKKLNSDTILFIEESYEPNYIMSINQESYTIYVNTKKLNSSYFTHELLHIYLHQKNISITNAINFAVVSKDNFKLISILSEKLTQHIANSLEHIKMLPIYLEMGFERKKFISDYNKKKITLREIFILQDNFQINDTYLGDAVDLFIGKFFAVKCCPNNKINYSHQLNKLESISPSLFKVLLDFLKKWQSFDIVKNPTKYEEIIEHFIEELDEWTKGKKIK